MEWVMPVKEKRKLKSDKAGRTESVVARPMPDIAQLIGGKWKLIILQILIFDGMKRFNQLRREIDGVTQTMLTNQLRALERDGLVSRKVYAEVPPRVEYSATQRAVDLTAVFRAMHDWWAKGEKAKQKKL
jgi:DNA-binding HxlR family transcriptional regulator